MSPPKSSLDSFISWPALADALELPVASQALPASTVCPTCHKSNLTVYQDSITGGGWHHCFDCGQSGDLIELASYAWKITPKAALVKLVERGFPLSASNITDVNVNGYLDKYVQKRRRTKELWEEARRYVVTGNTPSLNYLKAYFRLNATLSQQRMVEGPAKLFGALPRKQVEQFCGRTNKNRVFQGRGWQDVVVIPRFDLPDRICGFEFIGRNGEPEDRVIRAVGEFSGRGFPREIGLAGLQLVSLKSSVLGNTVIAVPDAMLLLRFQMRQFNTSLVPLPVVAWHDSPKHFTNSAWISLKDRKVVFWAPHIDAATVQQAQSMNAWISTVGPNPGSTWTDWYGYIGENSALDLARLIDRTAKPWSEAVEKATKDWNDGAVATLLNDLERRGCDVHEVVSTCNLRTNVSVRISGVKHTKLLDTGFVEREDSGWYSIKADGRGEKLITDAILRIEKIVSGDDTYYCGKVRYRGEEYPFVERQKAVESNTSRWIRSLLLNRKVGRSVCAWEKKWSGWLVPLATQFYEPEIVSDTDCPDIGASVLDMVCRSLEAGCAFSAATNEETSDSVPNLVARLLAQAHVRGGVKFARHGHERSLRELRHGAAVVFFQGEEILVDRRAFRDVLKKVKAPLVPFPSREWPIRVNRAEFLSALDKLPPVVDTASQSAEDSGSQNSSST
jgi:hypothetical protein